MITIKTHLDINKDYYSLILILIYKIKSKIIYQHLSKDEKMSDLCNYSAKSNYYDYSNKLVGGKM